VGALGDAGAWERDCNYPDLLRYTKQIKELALWLINRTDQIELNFYIKGEP